MVATSYVVLKAINSFSFNIKNLETFEWDIKNLKQVNKPPYVNQITNITPFGVKQNRKLKYTEWDEEKFMTAKVLVQSPLQGVYKEYLDHNDTTDHQGRTV